MKSKVLYLGYYLKNMKLESLIKFIRHASKLSDRNKIYLFISSINAVFKYNVSILEYFQFRFWEKSKEEKESYAGTGFMYEYQLIMNPRDKRLILDDKKLFFENYKKYFLHRVFSLEEIKNSIEASNILLNNENKKVVLKISNGKCGAQVEIVNADDFNRQTLIEYMIKKKYDLAEEYIVQHKELMRLSPSAVNTVRIFTQLDNNDKVDVLGCRLRISVNSSVDNLAAGNLAAPIDESTGIICGKGVYSDITKEDEEYHPITKIKIKGFQVPFWKDALELAKNAALLHKENRSIGWDIVITDNGPGLIEGNHDWCKLLWQLPVKKGLKPMLEKYLE